MNILIEKVLVIVLAVIQILGMHQLHCNEFAAFLRIWKTLVEMTELKREFLQEIGVKFIFEVCDYLISLLQFLISSTFEVSLLLHLLEVVKLLAIVR